MPRTRRLIIPELHEMKCTYSQANGKHTLRFLQWDDGIVAREIVVHLDMIDLSDLAHKLWDSLDTAGRSLLAAETAMKGD